MVSTRLPWEIVETLPSTDRETIDHWDERLADAERRQDATACCRALVGSALARYWAVSEGLDARREDESLADRRARVARAEALARDTGVPELLVEALLGRLYACWGPDDLGGRGPVLRELVGLHDLVDDEELRYRIREWVVVEHFDHGDLAAARADIEAFRSAAATTELVLFRRREELWRANLAMLEGRLGDAVRINEDAVSSTAGTAGTPFSFQNLAITLAIERYLRRGLADVVDAVRSIRASSPRVAANWTTGLALTLCEMGELDEARQLFEELADDDFATVSRDLNWLVTMQLLGLVALHLDDGARVRQLLAHLEPHVALDGTHGSGYASYGPVGRVVGMLQTRLEADDGGRDAFDLVLRTRDPGPWTSLTRLDSAASRRRVDPTTALAEATRAEQELRDFDMAAWAVDARALRISLLLEGHGGPAAVSRGDDWVLWHPTGSATVRDSIGVRHLLTLLARPGETVETVDLDGVVDPSLARTATPFRTADPEARAAYRRRLDTLAGDPDADPAEIEFLRRELAGARFVASGSAELERVRIRVTKALTRAMGAVAEEAPALGAHLRGAVETGRRCIYGPPDGAAWQVLVEHP